MRTFLGLFIALAPLVAGGQGNTATGMATVEGDVYLVMANGDVKKGAGNTVVVARATPQLRATLDTVCSEISTSLRQHDRYMAAFSEPSLTTAIVTTRMKADRTKNPADIKAADSVEAVRKAHLDSSSTLWAARDRLKQLAGTAIAQAAVQRAPTGMEAHYKAEGLALGEYLLFAETTIMDKTHQWLRAANVVAGANRFDLDNSVTTTGPYCIRR